MKKCIFLIIIFAMLPALTACNRENDAPEPPIDLSEIYQSEVVQGPIYQPQVVQDIEEPPPPQRPAYVTAAPVEEGLIIRIDRATDELLDSFDKLHVFDYNVVLDARDAIIRDGTDSRDSDGESIVIWANQPLASFEVLLIGNVILNYGEPFYFYIPIGSFGLIDEFLPGEAFVINSYHQARSFSWSGITFVDEDEVKRYYVIGRRWHPLGRSYSYSLEEFKDRTYELPGDGQPSWQDIKPIAPTVEPRITEPCIERRVVLLEQSGISEYGWQVAADFLSKFDSLFTRVRAVEIVWDAEIEARVPTGRFHAGWDFNASQSITTYEVPEFHHFWSWTCEKTGIFDRHGNKIYDVPWIYAQRGEGWASYHYADYFNLYDFDNTGIPNIIVHFQQTFQGCYGGFSRIFRYIDGEYRMLEMTAYIDGEQQPWVSFGTHHRLFIDDTDRVIAFVSADGMSYEHFILFNDRVELHFLDGTPHNGREWEEHHWSMTVFLPSGQPVSVDNWINHNPTIFGTDISLTPLRLTDLSAEMLTYLQNKRQ